MKDLLAWLKQFFVGCIALAIISTGFIVLAACRTFRASMRYCWPQMNHGSDMSNFRSFDRHTAYLLPPSVDDWLPQDHLA